MNTRHDSSSQCSVRFTITEQQVRAPANVYNTDVSGERVLQEEYRVHSPRLTLKCIFNAVHTVSPAGSIFCHFPYNTLF